MYVSTHNSICSSDITMPSINNVTSEHKLSALWHMRLGHASSPVLPHIDSISYCVSDKHNKHCPILPVSKQTKCHVLSVIVMLLTPLI